MKGFLGQSVQANLTASCFPRLTKQSFFAMLKKTKGNP
jgi:hypothetical protein